MNNSIEELELLSELIHEQTRAKRIALGLEPDPPAQSIEELRAELALRRAENDLAAAEAAAQRRRADLRVVD